MRNQGLDVPVEPLEGLRVLVVEDEPLIAEELRVRLTGLGMDVVGPVVSGAEAIFFAGDPHMRLVLMDIRLKGELDGIDAAATILARFDVPLVFVTAHSDEGTIRRATQVGPSGYLVKPFQGRDLTIAVTMALRTHTLHSRLRQSERRYVVTLSSIADGIVATNAQGQVTFMNPASEALTGWAQAEAIGRPIADVCQIEPVPPPQIGRPDGAGSRRTLPDPSREYARLVARNGDAIPIDHSHAPISNDDGELDGDVRVLRDMTERVEAARRLSAVEAHLRQSQKMEAVGRLAGGVAHEINNMMTVVLGHSGMLLEDPALIRPHRRIVEELQGAGERTAALARQLLAFSRREAGKPVVLPLWRTVCEMQPRLRRLIRDDIDLRCLVTRDAGSVRADRGQLEEVITNLVSNAKDAMPEGGTLTIEVSNVTFDETTAAEWPEMRAGDYVMLAVSDTGTGVDPAVKPKIFEPFFTTKGFKKETGLGLAVVHGIVQDAGGHITLHSEAGQGTVFTVFFPRVKEPAAWIAPAFYDPPKLGASSEGLR